MVELFCTPFAQLIDRMRLEQATQQSLFDLPTRKWHAPSSTDKDISVRFHGLPAGNPVGPASGPQSQMAQNLVLAWLAGSRIMELKTVQINDQLEITRPCIDATNVGYNIEWSQELRIHESLDQYVQGAMLIHMLRSCPEEFGNPFGEADLQGAAGDTVFDMSVGYDLKGIRSEKITGFIHQMMDASQEVERLRSQIPHRMKKLRDLDYPTEISRSITLSTFHGCPAEEIEKIGEYLLGELGVHLIIKMNPPMLGKERLEHLLHDVMGYNEISVHPGAYTGSIQFDECIEMSDRLSRLAQSKGLNYGAKFSNTLEVTNHLELFGPEEKVMYLSGAPLHVIALALANEFRQAIEKNDSSASSQRPRKSGAPASDAPCCKMPISFSAGVDRKNFANMVACGFTPITTCTDLLKAGGYGRLPPYLKELQKAMDKVGAKNINDFVLDSRGQREASGGDPVRAGLLNTAIIAKETEADERYHSAKNQGVPKKIGSHLVIFDCITCDKCIPVCPNDANFSYTPGNIDLTYQDIEVGTDGSITQVGEEKAFKVEQKAQIANFADYCNHCGNCDTFCPEYDGPYLKKPSFFGSERAFLEGSPHDGFFLEKQPEGYSLRGRIQGQAYRLQTTTDGGHLYSDEALTMGVTKSGAISLDSSPPSTQQRIDMGYYHTFVTLLLGITDTKRVHAVNAPLIAEKEGTA